MFLVALDQWSQMDGIAHAKNEKKHSDIPLTSSIFRTPSPTTPNISQKHMGMGHTY